jgi:phosphoribosylformylglycinamidine cyclo-ligase/phosphoribosylamine--glycine ligase/phosphoribosylformylglycinamidine cyclo-ligase
MPGVYVPDAFDVAGSIVGIVDGDRRLPRAGMTAGDVLIGLASTGPHTNGYSLIRRVFAGMSLDTVYPELGVPLVDALLAPHRSYLQLLWPVLQEEAQPVKALAHLTGGGIIENLPRVLPEGLGAAVVRGSWPVPPLFSLIEARGGVAPDEMFRVFNMGLGLVVIVAPADVVALQARLGEPSWVVGEVVAGDRQVRLA